MRVTQHTLSIPKLLCLVAIFSLPQCKKEQSIDIDKDNTAPIRVNPAPSSARHTAPNSNTPQQQARIASVMVDNWQNIKPVKKRYPLQIVYWSPKGRAPTNLFRSRISKVLLTAQKFYREEMIRHELGDRTFQLTMQSKGICKIHLVQSETQTLDGDNKSPNLGAIQDECLQAMRKKGIDLAKTSSLIFLNSATWENNSQQLSHTLVPGYIYSDIPFANSAFIADSPMVDFTQFDNRSKSFDFIDLKHPQTRKKVISLGHYNRSYYKYLATQIGNSLGLPAVRDYDISSNSVQPVMLYRHMFLDTPFLRTGIGFALSLKSALILRSHPAFTDSVKAITVKPKHQLDDLKFSATATKQTLIEGTVQSSVPAYLAVLSLKKVSEPISTIHQTTAIAKDQKFSFKLPKLLPDSTYQVSIGFVHCNGWSNKMQIQQLDHRYSLFTHTSGEVNLTALDSSIALTKLGLLVGASDLSGVQLEIAKIEKQKLTPATLQVARALANSVLRIDEPISPTNIPSNIKEIPLSITQPEKSVVGWDKLISDRLPLDNALVLHMGRIYPRSLYAHANSKIHYNLGKKWRTFSGFSTICEGRSGIASFEILGDGKSLWKSQPLSQYDIKEFKIDVQGVKQLELRATHQPGRKPACWSLWLNPQLSR